MSRRATSLILLLCLSQSAFAFEEELAFVKGLTENGFPQLAEKVLNRTLQQFPEAGKEAPELRIRILIASKQFEKAAQQIGNQQSEIGNAESLWLFFAEAAYAARQLPDAETAYKHYFKLLTQADGATGQAAFNYGELLEERGDDAAARNVYEQALKRIDSRPVKAKLAALLVENDPARAQKLCEEVQLGGLDLWFGQAVVTWSQLMTIQEEWGEAQSVLEMQLELLKQLEESLEAQGQPVSLVSPLSGARYLLGVCYEHEDKKAEALHQFYNVYAKYGDSEWGPKAQEKAQALKEWFEGQGKTVKIDLGANLSKMEESTFRVARRLFFDRQYAEAVPIYLDALNKYPEGNESITALRELCLSAVHLNDELGAKNVGLYLSERFAGDPKAGDALLAAGKGALDAKQEDLAWWMYDRAIEAVPAHPRMPAVLFSLAGLQKNDDYLKKIIADYPDSSYRARALGRLAWNAYEAEDYEAAAERFAPYVDTETDLQKQTRARFAFAESYRHLELWGAGSACFQTLEKSMEEAAESYGASAETLEFNRPFWEKAVYYQAVCQKELGDPDAAVQTCDRFIEKFPTSGILDQVQFTKAKTLIERERFAEALVTLEPLDGKFAEPVCYYRGVAQFETGANEAAIQTLEKLLVTWPSSAFTYEALFVQGRAYVAAGQRDEAVRVFGDILNFASDDLLLNRASLELGRAQTDPTEKLASFQRVALLADPDDPEQAPLISEALYESLPLYLELARHNDLLADADRLLSDFPNIGKSEEIETMKTKAKEAIAQQKEGTTNEHK
ncbi:MAG: tetratricopeptide repeat protein [Verrucomicrobia bacterium]|nr:tetratricopeptide repeat protein [Verrucomicrobiota bacterium]